MAQPTLADLKAAFAVIANYSHEPHIKDFAMANFRTINLDRPLSDGNWVIPSIKAVDKGAIEDDLRA